jgi:hypothetical protein
MIVSEPYDVHYDHANELIRQMMNWRHKLTPFGTWDLESFEAGNDHLIDCNRYILDRFLIDKTQVSIASQIDTSPIIAQTVNPLTLQSIQETYRQHGVSPDVISAVDVNSMLIEAEKLSDDGVQKRSSKVRFSF